MADDSTPVDRTDAYSMIVVDEAERTPSKASGTDHVDLVSELGCTEMHPKMWYLRPGDAMSYHRQNQQEELYYVAEGPGRMKIAGELMDVPEGAVVRIPPDTPRQVFNDQKKGEHVWLIIGAPATEDDGLPPSDDEKK